MRVLAVVLLLLTCPLWANEEARAIHAQRMAEFANLPKEVTPGCLQTPIPVTPTGPTWSFEANTRTASSPRIVRGTFWRKPCATAGNAQLILTLTPITSTPFVCSVGPVLIQNSQQTDDISFDTSPNTSTTDSFCSDLFVPTSVVIEERSSSFTFDDDAPFTFAFETDQPSAIVNVGGYDPAAYNLPNQNQPIAGKLSGSYYSPARDGEGVLIEVGRIGLRRTFFLTWYTYAGGLQRWIVGNLDYAAGATVLTVPLFVTTGGQFGAAYNPAQVQASAFGSATVSFPTCSTMRFQWSENGGQSGVYDYQRLVEGVEGVACP